VSHANQSRPGEVGGYEMAMPKPNTWDSFTETKNKYKNPETKTEANIV
jgi:hypothetical protein